MNFLHRLNQKELAADHLSRRQFLQVSSISGGLLMGCGSMSFAPPAQAADTPVFNAFVKITLDNKVVVIIKHMDMGQGVSTGLATVIAEELGARWEQVTFEFAPADAKQYHNLFWGSAQGTGGSSSIANSWGQLRTAGAAVREMLQAAAAAKWQVPQQEIIIKEGLISHGKRRAQLGEFAALAALLPVPSAPKLKDPKDFHLIGKNIPRQDSKAKTDGSAVYTQDIYLDGMLTALVAYPPQAYGKVKSVDATRAKATPGVKAVVEIPRGVAVIADNFWAAKKARALLTIQWDLSACETRSSDALFAECHQLAKQPGSTVKTIGDAPAALSTVEKIINAEYELPYLAHAPIEPMNCVVLLTKDQAQLWFASQMPTQDQQEVAAVVGLKPEQVKINSLFAGGSFGRRACAQDYVVDAANIAKQMRGVPIKMVWTREDELLNARFRPMAVHQVRGAVLADGAIAWQHHAVAPSILRGTPFAGLVKGPVDGTVVEGIEDTPYSIQHLQVAGSEFPSKIPTLWWRSVGHSGNAFVVETFLDQLARSAQKDPVVLRRELLAKEPRALAALNLVAEKAQWQMPLPAGLQRGIAIHKSFNTWVAQVAFVRINEDKTFKVEKVVCAVDCGIAVNPDVVRAQMEGAIGMGLGAALGEAITLKNGVLEQTNFHQYTPLRITDMPHVEVFIVPSAEAPTGVGEPGLPPIAPAVANALFAATGQPITKLPLGKRV